jgi:hypothetical protein
MTPEGAVGMEKPLQAALAGVCVFVLGLAAVLCVFVLGSFLLVEVGAILVLCGAAMGVFSIVVFCNSFELFGSRRDGSVGVPWPILAWIGLAMGAASAVFVGVYLLLAGTA